MLWHLLLCTHTAPRLLCASVMISVYQQVRDNDHEGDGHAAGVVGEPATWDVCVRAWEVVTD